MKAPPLRILSAILISSVAVAPGWSQLQFSANAVGYVDVNFVAGSNLVANPLNAFDNRIAQVFRGVPVGTTFFPWDRNLQNFGTGNVFHTASGWTDPNAQLVMPEGGFLWLPSAATISFVGDVLWPISDCYSYHPSGVTVMPRRQCALCIQACPTFPDQATMWRWSRAGQNWSYFIFDGPQNVWRDQNYAPSNVQLNPDESALFVINDPYSSFAFPNTVSAPGGNAIQPPALRNWQRSGPNVRFGFSVSNTVGYTLLHTTNLNSPWNVLQQRTAYPSNGLAMLDVPAPTNGAAFYKLAEVSAPTPIPRLTYPSRSGTEFQFYFYALQGTNYNVQRKTNLNQTTWQTIQTVTGMDSFLTVTDTTATASSGYYRLQY